MCTAFIYKMNVCCVNMDTHSHSYTPASKHACRTVQQPLPFSCWRYICGPDVRCTLRCCWAQDVLHSLCGTCEAFLWAVRLAALVCVSWGSVCLGPLLAGSRDLDRTVSMQIQGRCGVLNQVVRGNSHPGRRVTLAALCGCSALHNKIFPD